ncbi:hypothetical protein A2Y99_01265 [Candidatus Gottesmanbacteria bacterium RBG_13_37_7]|uniref:ABC transporter domain-containing protein n=1 Tax=Candidatus Gottesmanbacteria bacterium RBG_13_37_7 TaxID=1798369 RepID=A0A1F5YHD2_9BACT|nr:MAG: hypothetical protein A2Y99_01265 [Candidatus Gottesmanbacteria bacterium RBG_13_37_7]
MKPIIEVKNISKKYKIGLHRVNNTLNDEISDFFRNLSSFRQKKKDINKASEFWALKDINFTVEQGEVLGIIGRNGAGKSTLLKILSQITPPTTGEIILRGRVASLLEVGTGFHPELTGRENIYLNGAILGMSQKEIKQKFDKIVDFAEIEKFLDTPVKRYSSGMHTRLAFAVAAHLDPDILIVDEVLSVGDLQYQRKCINKMLSIAGRGVTILVVSHNTQIVMRLCKRVLYFDNGKLIADGEAKNIVDKYLDKISLYKGERYFSKKECNSNKKLKMISISIRNKKGEVTNSLDITKEHNIHLVYETLEKNLSFRCVVIFQKQNICAFSSFEPTEIVRSHKGRYGSIMTVPPNLLAEGEYTISVSVFHENNIKEYFVSVKEALTFQVFDKMTGKSARGDYSGRLIGVIRPVFKWTMQNLSHNDNQ